jgi:hypothetical protein
MEPELDRRGFLARLGALVGAAALGGTVAACGSRPTKQTSDGSPWVTVDAGGAPMMDAKLDTTPHHYPDGSGVAPMMDAQLDQQAPSSDGAKLNSDGN